MELWVGTSGFSYPEWKGSFYPEKLPREGMLRYYAERLPSVEINNTFYRMPRPELLESWAREVPERFAFVLKAPRRITHIKRLRDAEPEVEHLYRTAGQLGARRGPILFQLPPNLKRDVERLRRFLACLPADHRAAVEFRDDSWRDPEVQEALREAQAAWCCADPAPSGEADLVPTTDFGYARLRRVDYDEASLRVWAERIRRQPWRRAYVFFKHEDAGSGPALALRFRELFEAAAPSPPA